MQRAAALSSVSIRLLAAALLSAAVACAACESARTSVTEPTGSKCDISVTNSPPELPASGGSGTITLTTSRDCAWSTSTDAAWIALSLTNGQGPATVSYTVQPNPRGTPRRGGIVVAQQTIQVAQAAAECRFDVSPAAVTVDSSGHQVSVSVTATDGCAWTARSSAPWIGQPSPAEGTGSAVVQLTVAP